MAYDLRNKCQNASKCGIFKKNTKKILGRGHLSQVGRGLPLPLWELAKTNLGVIRRGVFGGLAPTPWTSVLKFNVRKIMINFDTFEKVRAPLPNSPRRLRHLDPSHSKILGTSLLPQAKPGQMPGVRIE